MEEIEMAELPEAPLIRIVKKAGIERVAGDSEIAEVVEKALIEKFKRAKSALDKVGKSTLTKEFVELALA